LVWCVCDTRLGSLLRTGNTKLKHVYLSYLYIRMTLPLCGLKNDFALMWRTRFLTSYVGMTSVHVMHVSSYTVVDIISVGNADLYIVLVKSCYFTVCQEGAGCLTAILGLRLVSKHYDSS
jgi:hypothetical protein